VSPDWIEVLGGVAGVMTTAAFLPQAIKTWRTRRTRDISLSMFLTMCVGIILWLIYGVLIRSWPLIWANGSTLLLAGSILWVKWRNRHDDET
jgi:MtN3 and saliva related transmembrane protein